MIRDLIPAKARKVVYVVFGFVITAESALDAIGEGVLTSKVQGIVVAVLGAAGFSLAAGNTPKP
jgi:hypothetical protein